MVKRLILASGLLLTVLVRPLAALTEIPFVDQRIVSEDGTHYVVLRRLGNGVYDEAVGPVELLLCESHLANRGRVRSARGKLEQIVDGQGDSGARFYVRATVGVGDNDRIVKRVELPAPPQDVLIAADNQYVVCVGVWGHSGPVLSGHYPAVRIIRFDDGDTVSLAFEDIFGADDAKMIRQTARNGVAWYEGAWLMEVTGAPKRLAVIAVQPERIDEESCNFFGSPRRPISLVNLSTRECRPGRLQDVVINSLYGHNPIARRRAIQAARRFQLTFAVPGLRVLAKHAETARTRRLARIALRELGLRGERRPSGR